MNHHLLAFLDLSLNDLYIKQNKKQKRALLSALSHTRGPRQHSLSHSSVHFLFYTLISLVVRIVFLLLLLLLLADALAVTRQPTESIKNVMDRTPLLGARQGPDQTHTHTPGRSPRRLRRDTHVLLLLLLLRRGNENFFIYNRQASSGREREEKLVIGELWCWVNWQRECVVFVQFGWRRRRTSRRKAFSYSLALLGAPTSNRWYISQSNDE